MNNEGPNRNNNPNNNPNNVNMYFPPSSQQNIPINQGHEQGYGYGASGQQQSYNYPVPDVNPNEAHHEERGEFVLPNSAKVMMMICAIFCFLVFLIFLFIK